MTHVRAPRSVRCLFCGLQARPRFKPVTAAVGGSAFDFSGSLCIVVVVALHARSDDVFMASKL